MSLHHRDSKMIVETSVPVVDKNPASPAPVAQLATPPSSAINAKSGAFTLNNAVQDSPTAARAPKRKRSITPDESDYEPAAPVVSTKNAKGTATKVAIPRKKPSKTPAQLEAAAENAKIKAERTAVKAADKQRKKDEKRWKEDWKDWVSKNDKKSKKTKFDQDETDCLTVTKCKRFFKLKDAELKCLAFEERPNPNDPRWAPMKLYSCDGVVDLACKKEAILAGVSQRNESTLIAYGRALLEAKGLIPSNRGSVSRVTNPLRTGLERKRRQLSPEPESEVECDPCQNNMPCVEYLQDNPDGWFFNRPKVSAD